MATKFLKIGKTIHLNHHLRNYVTDKSKTQCIESYIGTIGFLLYMAITLALWLLCDLTVFVDLYWKKFVIFPSLCSHFKFFLQKGFLVVF